MRAGSFAAVVIMGFLGSSIVAHAAPRREGEVSSDVTVRVSPDANAAAVRDISSGTQVTVVDKRKGWVRIGSPARGWIPSDAFVDGNNENAQRSALLKQIASAAADAQAQGDDQGQSDADLMYNALKKWHGEPKDGATIDRVVAGAKKEADRDRKVARERVRAVFWKDPFSDQPQKLIPVRKEDRDLLASARARARSRGTSESGEIEQLREEAAAARADAEAARAEAARFKAELARGECPTTEVAAGDNFHPRRHLGVRRARRDHAPAEGAGAAPIEAERHHEVRLAAASDRPPSGRSDMVAAVSPPSADAAPLPPPGWKSSDPRGIIIVPIGAPAQSHADKKNH